MDLIPLVTGNFKKIIKGSVIRKSILGQICKATALVSYEETKFPEAIPIVIKECNYVKRDYAHEDPMKEIQILYDINISRNSNVIKIFGIFKRGNPSSKNNLTPEEELIKQSICAINFEILHPEDELPQTDVFFGCLLEYCKSDFFDISIKRLLTLDMVQTYFADLVTGVYNFHKLGIAHRDLSLENLLLDYDNQLKICDFGVACYCKPGEKIYDGQLVGKFDYYMPPEVINGEAYDPFLVDVWCCGIILSALLTGIHLFKNVNENDVRYKYTVNGNSDKLLQIWKLEPLPSDAQDLINKMICLSDKRIQMKDVINHPYVVKNLTSKNRVYYS